MGNFDWELDPPPDPYDDRLAPCDGCGHEDGECACPCCVEPAEEKPNG